MAKEKNGVNTKGYGSYPNGSPAKDISWNTTDIVGPSRRYVSGDEEKSSSSHQFHRDSAEEEK